MGNVLVIAEGVPSWATYDYATGKFTGTPAPGDVGSLTNVTFTAVDGDGATDAEVVEFAVAAANVAPEINQTQADAVFDYGAGHTNEIFSSSPGGDERFVQVPTANEGIWEEWHLQQATGIPTVVLNDRNYVVFSDKTDHLDGGLTYSGTWIGTSIDGTPLNRSDVIGEYVEFTTAATTLPIVYFGFTSNGGLGKVYIDGDPTAAKALATAQELVDKGFAADTILAANGGYFAPTDRVIDCDNSVGSGSGVVGVLGTVLAYGLTDTAHVIRVEVTGEQATLGAGTRVYFGGHGVALAPDVGTDKSVFKLGLYSVYDSADIKSAIELAVLHKPTPGGTYEWSGSLHGGETPVSFIINENTATRLRITKTTEFTHTEEAGAFATAVVVYTFTSGGLEVDTTVTWIKAAYISSAYLAMQPTRQQLNTFLRNTRATRARASSQTFTRRVDVDDSANHSFGPATTAWQYDHEREYVVVTQLQGAHPHNLSDIFVEDRPDQGVNKFYFKYDAGGGNQVAASTVWNTTAIHRGYFVPEGAQSLAGESVGGTGIVSSITGSIIGSMVGRIIR